MTQVIQRPGMGVATARTGIARLLSAACAWGVGLVALALGASLVCVDAACRASGIDATLLRRLHDAQHPLLSTFFGAATWLGSIAVLMPAALVLAWYFHRRGHRAAALLLPLSVGGAWLWAHLAKLLVLRPRPDLFPPLIELPADLSFPSAHTMQVAAFALGLMLAPEMRGRHRLAAIAVLIVLLVAVSRVYLQVHYPSDVVFGALAAAGWVVGLRLLIGARP